MCIGKVGKEGKILCAAKIFTIVAEKKFKHLSWKRIRW
jgi:hypothetical protein